MTYRLVTMNTYLSKYNKLDRIDDAFLFFRIMVGAKIPERYKCKRYLTLMIVRYPIFTLKRDIERLSFIIEMYESHLKFKQPVIE